MDDKKPDFDKTLDAVWCIDSENPKAGWMLIDLQTNEILARKGSDGKIV